MVQLCIGMNGGLSAVAWEKTSYFQQATTAKAEDVLCLGADRRAVEAKIVVRKLLPSIRKHRPEHAKNWCPFLEYGIPIQYYCALDENWDVIPLAR